MERDASTSHNVQNREGLDCDVLFTIRIADFDIYIFHRCYSLINCFEALFLLATKLSHCTEADDFWNCMAWQMLIQN